MALSDLLSYAAVIGFAVAVGLYARWDIRRRARHAGERRALLSGYAQHREWAYADSDPTLLDRFHGHPFDEGNERYTRNVLTGRHDNRPFVAFDYESVVRRRKSTDRYPYSVVALDLGVPTPGLSVSPAGFVDRVVDAVTGRDITIGRPAFDEAFTVTSTDAEFAADLLRTDVIDVLMQHRELAWRLDGPFLVVIRKGQHTPGEIEAKLHFMDAVLDRIPEHVRARLGGPPR